MPFLRARPCLLPVCVALCGAAAAILWVGPNVANFGDARDYAAAARALGAGESYPRQSSLPFFRAPLYPGLIALIWSVGPDSFAAVKAAQALLLAASCGLVCWLGLRLHGSQVGALAGGLALALDPLAVASVAGIQTETLHMALVTAGLLALVNTLRAGAPARRGAIVAGLCFGLASLTRPSALPVALVLGVGLWWLRPREDRSIAPPAMFFAALSCVILPWTLANWKATGEPILISDAAGYHFWLGNNPEALKLYRGDFANRAEMNSYGYRYLQKQLPARAIAGWQKAGGYWSRSLQGREALWREEAWRTARANPGVTAQLWMLKVWAYWRPWLHPTGYSFLLVVASGVFGLSVYGLGLYGAWCLIQKPEGRPRLGLILLVFASSTAVHVASHSMVRFRIPYVEPALAALAGLGVASLAGQARERR